MDGLWATKSKCAGLIVRTISFQDFQPMWSWSTNVTDRRRDGWMDDMHLQYRALHYSASCGKQFGNVPLSSAMAHCNVCPHPEAGQSCGYNSLHHVHVLWIACLYMDRCWRESSWLGRDDSATHSRRVSRVMSCRSRPAVHSAHTLCRHLPSVVGKQSVTGLATRFINHCSGTSCC